MRPLCHRLALASCCLTLMAACDEPGAVACAFLETQPIGQSEGDGYDAIALEPNDDGAWLVWSERSGTHARRLDREGAPVADAVQLGARCEAGVDTARDGDRLLVACGQRGDPDRGRDGAVVLIELEGERTRVLAQWSSVGRRSRGVALTAIGADHWVGWQDASASTSRSRLARFAGGVGEEARVVSSFNVQGGPPAITERDGQPLVAWTEGVIDRAGAMSGRLLVRHGDRPSRPSLDVGELDVPIQLVQREGRVTIALRDSRPAGARHRVFLGHLDDHFALDLADVRSPGRADGEAAPIALTECGGSLFAVTHRRSSRGVTMASLRRIDPETLSPLEDEHQIYEYHSRLTRSAAACVAGRLLVAVGERRTSGTQDPRLRAHVLRCAAGLTHERTPPRRMPR